MQNPKNTKIFVRKHQHHPRKIRRVEKSDQQPHRDFLVAGQRVRLSIGLEAQLADVPLERK